MVDSGPQDPTNPDLNDALFRGSIVPEDLATMAPEVRLPRTFAWDSALSGPLSAQEMASNELKNKRDAERKWALDCARSDLHKVRSLGPARSRGTLAHSTQRSQDEAVTDEFKCGRCKKRRCSYYQKQTR
jgi:DNA-directed RNA polymerase subunit M/transcription elongation factor TFIIS